MSQEQSSHNKNLSSNQMNCIFNILNENGITDFYHFTSIRNIDSIKKHGLCSLRKVINDGIDAKVNADNLSAELDTKKGTINYVHLSFFPNEKMWYCVAQRQLKDERGALIVNRKYIEKYMYEKFVLLKIDISIIVEEGVYICPTNAASNNAIFYSDVLEGLKNTNLRDPYNQAEILVPKVIPARFITFDDGAEDFFYDESIAGPDGLVYLCDGCYIDSKGNLHWSKNR